MKIGVFDHMERDQASFDDLYEDRLNLAEAHDKAGVYDCHVAENHAPSPGVALCRGIWLAALRDDPAALSLMAGARVMSSLVKQRAERWR